jgi:peptidoglycan/xylan/chitin deacetylase (PgdA/CDA1 family)
MTHPRLSRISHDDALAEISSSKSVIEAEIGRPVRHFAYPVGDAGSAAAPEFGMVRAAGFASGVTTRPGHVFADHAQHLAALPRVSLNGLHQNMPALHAMLSGLPFLALNRGRKLDVR